MGKGQINMIPLTPSKRNPFREPKNFGVFDIEAKNWIEMVLIGYYTAIKDPESGLVMDEIMLQTESMSEFMEFIFSKDQPHNVIYAHFGGKYDFLFLLDYFIKNLDEYHAYDLIPRGSGLLQFAMCEKLPANPKTPASRILRIKRLDGQYDEFEKGREIVFKDSAGILPMSLAALTKNFKTETAKGEIDYEKIDKVTPELLDYHAADLKGLYQVIERFQEWPIIKESGTSSTIASQAMKVFQTHLKKSIPSLTPQVDNFVRQSYCGGRTEIIKPIFWSGRSNEILKSFDVNSLYPYVMAAFDYPSRYKATVSQYMSNEMGFWDVEVYVPDMYLPPLGAYIGKGSDRRFIFPVGTFRGQWTTYELNYAMSLGVKIKNYYGGMIFHNEGRIFEEFITELYDIRLKSDKNSADSVIAKLLMNSCYGRFGINRMREGLSLMASSDHTKLKAMDLPGGNTLLLSTELEEAERIFSNVGIASYVTSYARVHMHKLFMQSPESLWYTDTDSAKSSFNYKSNPKELGALKREYATKRAAYILPKSYLEELLSPEAKLYNQDLKQWYATSKKIVLKGFDRKKIANFDFEDFKEYLDGDKRLLSSTSRKIGTLKAAVKRGRILEVIEEADREIRASYNKRRIFRKSWNHFYDSEPLVIRDGEAINLEPLHDKYKDDDKMNLPDAMSELMGLI